MKKALDITEGLRAYIFPLLLLATILHKYSLYNILKVDALQKVSVGDLSVLLLVMLFVLTSNKRLLETIKSSPRLSFAGLAFILLSTMVVLIGHDINRHSIIFIASSFLFFLLIIVFINSETRSNTLNWVAIYIVLINLAGLVEYLFPEMIRGFLLSLKSEHALNIKKFERISSVMTNPNPFGVFNAIMFTVFLCIQYGFKKFLNIYLFIFSLILCVLGVILSGSNNALMTMLIGTLMFAVILAARNFRNLKWLALVLVIMVLVFIAALKISPSFSSSIGRVFPAANKIYCGERIEFKDIIPNRYLSDRDRIWKEGAELFMKSPVTGIGANQYLAKNRIEPDKFNMHNIFGEILVNHGIAGFVLFLILMAGWFIRIKSSWQAVIAVTAVLSHMIDCFITYNLPWIILVAWIIALTTTDFKNSGNMATRQAGSA